MLRPAKHFNLENFRLYGLDIRPIHGAFNWRVVCDSMYYEDNEPQHLTCYQLSLRPTAGIDACVHFSVCLNYLDRLIKS